MKGRDNDASIDRRGWDPNRISFEQGQPHLLNTMRQVGLEPDAQVFTSRDPVSRRIKPLLETPNVPPGIRKWQLPFSLYNPSNVYISEAKPHVKVPKHAHTHGAGWRVILKGSMVFNGTELTAGDWMYVPKGLPYEFEAGRRGVWVASGYEC